ncbi:hypothetical protein JBL43_16420 [Aureibaculum sp. A20]|uniref:Uncharacterized protein n=1 Tax=Aureibaculum flavum TaxID=2795986 RepID=A0ABS0WV80_9FLAO|nr:hypothetical protein [Aureibaculum flavum]MBJ2175840.1 hypothetical protein [Aureibaculum flavum]
MKTKLLLTIATLCLLLSCKEQASKQTIEKPAIAVAINDSLVFKETPNKHIELVTKIAKVNEVQFERVGAAGMPSANYHLYTQLKADATIQELLQLTDNKNATVACYASWALADQKYTDLKSIFLKFITHDRTVTTFKGCIISEDSISSELYHRYRYNLNDTNVATDKILTQLDSIVLYKPNSYWLLISRALDNRIYKAPIKTQITKLAFEHGNKDAIFYLSKWHKAAYKDQLKTALIKYLKETDFSATGTTDYYKTVAELFKFKDTETENIIITKLKNDRHWISQKQRFKFLLEDNYIYNIEDELQ